MPSVTEGLLKVKVLSCRVVVMTEAISLSVFVSKSSVGAYAIRTYFASQPSILRPPHTFVIVP